MSRFCNDSSDAFNVLEELEEGDSPSWKPIIPMKTKRICSSFTGQKFPMYEFAFKEAGMRLPFNAFQMGVFEWLDLAPSQLHPNALAFMRAFELVCAYLEVRATLPLFFQIFHIQRKVVQGRYSWVSFK